MNIFEAFKRESGVQEMTPDVIRKIIDEVNSDPLIGLGTLSKKEHLVDRLMAQWRICSAQAKGIPVKEARPLVLDKQAPPVSATAEKVAAVSKAAGM